MENLNNLIKTLTMLPDSYIVRSVNIELVRLENLAGCKILAEVLIKYEDEKLKVSNPDTK